MLLRENTVEASVFHFFLLHPTVTLSANPAGLSPKIDPQTSPVFDYTAGQNCCHFPLHYYTHLLTTLFAYDFVLIKSVVHTVIWVIILKTKLYHSSLPNPPIVPSFLKLKSRGLTMIWLYHFRCTASLLSPTPSFCSSNNSTLQPHLCTGCPYGICTEWFSLSLSLDFSSIITFSEIFLRSLHIKQHPLYKLHLFYIVIFFILLFFCTAIFSPMFLTVIFLHYKINSMRMRTCSGFFSIFSASSSRCWKNI